MEETTACEKVTQLNSKNKLGVIYDNYWIALVEYEDTADEYED